MKNACNNNNNKKIKNENILNPLSFFFFITQKIKKYSKLY